MAVWVCGSCGRTLPSERCPDCGVDPVVDVSLPEFHDVAERALAGRWAAWRWIGAALGAGFSLASAALLGALGLAALVEAWWVVALLAAPALGMVLGWIGVAVLEGEDAAAELLPEPRRDLNGAEVLVELAATARRVQVADELAWLWPVAAGARLGERVGRWVHPSPTARSERRA